MLKKKKIEMIQVTDEDGKITPIRFKVNTEVEEVICVVESSILIEERRFAGKSVRIYRASVVYSGLKREMKLVFTLETSTWSVEY